MKNLAPALLENKIFTWGSPKSKNVEYKVEHPVFSLDKNGLPTISYIDQFPEPKNMEQGLFLQKLSDALEESKKQIGISFTRWFINFFKQLFLVTWQESFKKNRIHLENCLELEVFFN